MLRFNSTLADILSRIDIELFFAVWAAEIIGGTLVLTAGCGVNVFYCVAHYRTVDFVLHDFLHVIDCGLKNGRPAHDCGVMVQGAEASTGG